MKGVIFEMKKLFKIVIVSCIVSCLFTQFAFAGQVLDEEEVHIAVEESELAVPLYDDFERNASGLTWKYGLYIDSGLVGGYHIKAHSGATQTVDYLYVKASMYFKDGSVKSNYNSASNSDYCETRFDDESTGNLPRKTNTFKSVHKFRHKGYASATKYVTKNNGDK